MDVTEEDYRRLEAEARRLLRGCNAPLRPDPASLCNRVYLGTLARELRNEDPAPARHFGYWRVALRNELLNHVRRQTRLKRTAPAVPLDGSDVPDPRADHARRSEAVDHVRRLATSQDLLARVLLLRAAAGYTCDEAADCLGVTRMDVENASRTLRRSLGRDDP